MYRGDDDWMLEGRCHGMTDEQLEMFHSRHRGPQERARKVCLSCPVLDECRQYMLSLPLSTWDGSIVAATGRLDRRAIQRDGTPLRTDDGSFTLAAAQAS